MTQPCVLLPAYNASVTMNAHEVNQTIFGSLQVQPRSEMSMPFVDLNDRAAHISLFIGPEMK